MMERIIIVHWNKSTGPEPIIQYPPEKAFPPKDLFLKIWANHELDKDNLVIEYIPDFTEDDYMYVSVLHLFEGETYFIVLVLDPETNISNFSDIFAMLSKNLIELLNTNKITRAISEAFTTINTYSEHGQEEEHLGFFRDKIKRTILNILREGAISKTRLLNTLRKNYGFSTVNIDLLLISFLHEGLIKKMYLPGIGETYFLIEDLIFLRTPPIRQPSNGAGKDFLQKYHSALLSYFQDYYLNFEKEMKLLSPILFENEVIELIKVLREHIIDVNECLNILNNNDDLFNELLEKSIIFESKGFVSLLSDIRYIKFVPFYLFKRLEERYEQKRISFDEYRKHIKILLELYEKNKKIIDYQLISN